MDKNQKFINNQVYALSDLNNFYQYCEVHSRLNYIGLKKNKKKKIAFFFKNKLKKKKVKYLSGQLKKFKNL